MRKLSFHHMCFCCHPGLAGYCTKSLDIQRPVSKVQTVPAPSSQSLCHIVVSSGLPNHWQQPKTTKKLRNKGKTTPGTHKTSIEWPNSLITFRNDVCVSILTRIDLEPSSLRRTKLHFCSQQKVFKDWHGWRAPRFASLHLCHAWSANEASGQFDGSQRAVCSKFVLDWKLLFYVKRGTRSWKLFWMCAIFMNLFKVERCLERSNQISRHLTSL